MADLSKFEGVAVVADVSSSEEDEDESNSEASSDRKSAPPNDDLGRHLSAASMGSRRDSMQRKRVKKPLASPTSEMTADDAEEFAAELDRVKLHHAPSANFSHLNLGFGITALKNALLNGQLQLLEVLVLSENSIASLPQNIFDKTPNLKKIDLTDNGLVHIPLSTFTLKHLETLLLDHNKIASVPATYDLADPFDLPSLTSIGLEWNKLTEFPSHLFEFAPKLTKIFICENLGIHTLPPKSTFRESPKTEIRLDNRPNVMRQFTEGGYADRIVPNWNKIYPDKVMDYVYLGSLRTAQCKEVYEDLDIRFVLTAGRHLDVWLADGMEQLELPLDDVPGEKIIPFFETAFQFIEKAINAKKGVLLHCFAGLSRSVTIVVAYLMKSKGLTRDEALHQVRLARPNSQPNEGFLASLLEYEHRLRAAS